MGKIAVVTVELVEESVLAADGAIANEMFEWFGSETVVAPWIKEVRRIDVEGS